MNTVLLACPISEKKDYCLDRWLDVASSLSYPAYDMYFVDNSHDPTYHRKILDKGFICDHIKPEGSPVHYIAICQEMIRKRFLTLGYDFFFSLECDVFPPKDIIERLLSHELPLVGASYLVGEGAAQTLCLQELEEDTPQAHSRLITPPEVTEAIDGTLKRVFACGIGCTLISREVIRKVGFRSRPKAREEAFKATFSDTYFYKDCLDQKIPVYLDTGTFARHERKNWEANIDFLN